MARCTVYRSRRKAETYLYVADELSFDDLPAELREAFGEPVLVMQLTVDEDRRLARVDTSQLLKKLETEGFYLQLPPEISVEDEITRGLY